MQPDEMLTEIRENLVGLTLEQATYLLARYDEAVINMNGNADGMAQAATQCREARHVADLTMAVLKVAADGPQWEGVKHFIRVLEGKYPWLIK